MYPRFLPCGEAALNVELGDGIDPKISTRVIALARSLSDEPLPGLEETVPTYRALLIRYDPGQIRGAALEEKVAERLKQIGDEAPTPRRWRVPVAYGGEAGMDLDDLAQLKNMTREELIAAHSSAVYRVYMIGFAPGFAYLGGLPEGLHTPRLAQPRQLIPAGAIGIGGQQASINSVPGPSGWRYIAGTPIKLFDPLREAPFLLEAGDEVLFDPIPQAEADRMAKANHQITPETP